MTLREWSERTGIIPTHHTTEAGAVSVTVADGDPNRELLHNLTDYRVGTSSKYVVWLLSKPTPKTPAEFLAVPRPDWHVVAETMSTLELQVLSRESDYLAQSAAYACAYLEWQSHNRGDHEGAVDYAEKELKKVRKALGYTYP